jgi:hypothetical protein
MDESYISNLIQKGLYAEDSYDIFCYRFYNALHSTFDAVNDSEMKVWYKRYLKCGSRDKFIHYVYKYYPNENWISWFEKK